MLQRETRKSESMFNTAVSTAKHYSTIHTMETRNKRRSTKKKLQVGRHGPRVIRLQAVIVTDSADWVTSVKVENRRQVRPMKQLLKYERFKTTHDGT